MATKPNRAMKPYKAMKPNPAATSRSRRADFAAVAVAVAAVALTVLGLAAAPAVAADRAAGEKLALDTCAACHGKDGNTPIDPSYPRLAGQHEDYLAESLRAYRSERRKNAIMGAQAKPLSNDDIRNLAAYFARLPGTMSHAR